MAKKTYAEKLRDPRWQKMRLKILERDKFMCQHCLDTTKTLHVHHLVYINGRDPWEYPESHLVTLCCDCHEEAPYSLAKYEAIILHRYRLLSKNAFDMHTVASVFERHEDLAYLFYLIWEMLPYQNEVINSLGKLKEKIDKREAKERDKA
jgi:hypothetical protein